MCQKLGKRQQLSITDIVTMLLRVIFTSSKPRNEDIRPGFFPSEAQQAFVVVGDTVASTQRKVHSVTADPRLIL